MSKLWLDASWSPTNDLFNLVPMFTGSLIIALLSVLLAAPAGILLAIFGHFYAPPFIAILYRSFIELLAGIPSVVYGFGGLIALVPFIARIAPPGASVLAGVLILTLMILPLAVIATENAFTQIPKQWLHAADSMALSTWGIIQRIALPYAWRSILSGIILQAGRALSETMAVLMVCGNIVQIPSSIFQPARTLTANIALEMAYATGTHTSALFVSGLVLLLLTETFARKPLVRCNFVG